MDMKDEFVGGVYAHNGRFMLALYQNKAGIGFNSAEFQDYGNHSNIPKIKIFLYQLHHASCKQFETIQFLFFVRLAMNQNKHRKKSIENWFPFEKFIWLLLCPSYSTARLSSSSVFQIQYLFRFLRNPSLTGAREIEREMGKIGG